MSHSDKLKKQAALDAVKDKKRIVFAIVGLIICISIVVQINSTATNPITEVVEVRVKNLMPNCWPRLKIQSMPSV